MSIYTKITVITGPGEAPEDLDDHPNGSFVDAIEWVSQTLSARSGVVLLRMWFGEQWGGQKTLIRNIGSPQDTLSAIRTRFPHAWAAWETRCSVRA